MIQQKSRKNKLETQTTRTILIIFGAGIVLVLGAYGLMNISSPPTRSISVVLAIGGVTLLLDAIYCCITVFRVSVWRVRLISILVFIASMALLVPIGFVFAFSLLAWGDGFGTL